MGQQQLLLLVLGIVIVGIAVVAGIQAFSEGKGKAEQDAAVSDAMRIISDVQAWKLKPQAFGGGSGSADVNFAALTSLKPLGYPQAGTTAQPYITTSGCYTIAGSATKATITILKLATSTTCSATTIATVDVTGPNSSNIAWAYAS